MYFVTHSKYSKGKLVKIAKQNVNISHLLSKFRKKNLPKSKYRKLKLQSSSYKVRQSQRRYCTNSSSSKPGIGNTLYTHPMTIWFY